MNINNLSDQVSISPQISVDDLRALSDMGVELVVCNRPDNEQSNQTRFADIAKEALKLGMDAQSIPFTAGNMSADDCSRFAKSLATGKRVTSSITRPEKLTTGEPTLISSRSMANR